MFLIGYPGFLQVPFDQLVDPSEESPECASDYVAWRLWEERAREVTLRDRGDRIYIGDLYILIHSSYFFQHYILYMLFLLLESQEVTVFHTDG